MTSTATQEAAQVPVPQAPPALPAHCFRMPLFHPGVRVRLDGRNETVSHIMIRKQLVCVHLVGREAPVRPDQLELQPTLFTTERRAEPLLV